MIHDLDVLLATVGGEVTSIEAVGVPVLTRRVDIANARLRFASGCIANLTASRISRERVRKVRFFQQQSYLSIDYASQEVEAFRLQTDGTAPVIEGGKLDVAHDEPLRLELADFVEPVPERRPASRARRRRPARAGVGASHRRTDAGRRTQQVERAGQRQEDGASAPPHKDVDIARGTGTQDR